MLSLLLRGKLTRTQVKSEGQGGFSCRHFNWINFRPFNEDVVSQYFFDAVNFRRFSQLGFSEIKR